MKKIIQTAVFVLIILHSAEFLFAQKASGERSLKISGELGFPHPSAQMTQWTDALIAYQNEPKFLYIKAYKPLIPLYFKLRSDGRRFSLFIPRMYKIFRGQNDLFDIEPDVNFRVVPQDLMQALRIPSFDTKETLQTYDRVRNMKVFSWKNQDGKLIRKIRTDANYFPLIQTEYNEAGYPYLEIYRSNWKFLEGVWFPFEIRLHRLLPVSNDVFLKIKDVRYGAEIEERLFEEDYPEDAETVTL